MVVGNEVWSIYFSSGSSSDIRVFICPATSPFIVMVSLREMQLKWKNLLQWNGEDKLRKRWAGM